MLTSLMDRDESYPEKYHFVGYNICSKGYKLLDNKTGKVVISLDVILMTDFGRMADPEVKSTKAIDENIKFTQYGASTSTAAEKVTC